MTSGVDPKLLEILVCPLCKGRLVYRKEAHELVCKLDRLAYPVKDGIPAMLTRADNASGTDRIAEAARQLRLGNDDIVVNLQGDEPLMEPALIAEVVNILCRQQEASVATACHAIHDAESFSNPNVVKVVLDQKGYALYFSRAGIPYPRQGQAEAYRHAGLYAYRVGFLLKISH